MDDHLKRRSAWRPWVALLAYLGVAVFATWPLAARIATHLPDGTDTLLHFWNGWWVRYALCHGQSPFYTRLLFYPAGVSLVYHNLAWLHILPWMALAPLVGGVGAYNVVFLIHLALCGWMVYWLARDLTGNEWAALLAGLVYQCWPYRMSQPSHPNLISTWGIPLFLLFLSRAIRRGRWQDGAWAGVALALVGYMRWQLLVPAVMVGALYWLLSLPAGIGRRQVKALLLAGGVVGVALAPPIALLAREWRTNPADLIREEEEATMDADLLAYITPAATHPLLGAFTRALYRQYYPERGSRFKFSSYLGLVPLLLVLVGIGVTRFRDSLPWIGIALCLFALALGPVLRIGGQSYPNVPMPYRFVARLWVVRLLRAPERFNMSLALPVAVLGAYGAAALFRRIGRDQAGWRVPLLGLLGGAVLFEYLSMPMLVQSARLSDLYARLAREPGEWAILNVPVDPYGSKPYMFAQTVHAHAIVQGHVSRLPRGAFAYLDSQPWLQAMRLYSLVPPKQADVGRRLAGLAQDGIRYLVVHKDLVGDENWARWARYLAAAPRMEDEDIAVYTTLPEAGRDFVLDPEIGPGIGVVRTVVSSPCPAQGQPLDLDVAWGTSAAPGRELAVEVALVSGDTGVRSSALWPIAKEWPANEWPAHSLAWGRYRLDVPADFPLGDARIVLALFDAETGERVGQEAAVEQVEVRSLPCAFPAPQGAVAVNAVLGDAMRLLGYRLEQGSDELALTLYWRSERRMEDDYKVFVHVFDPLTGVPAAQYDAMPLNWTYPTSYWTAGEEVRDPIVISLKDVPPGEYGVAVGVYHPASGERLAAVDSAGRAQPDGRVVLIGEIVRVER